MSEAGLKDITWFTPEGREATIADWNNPTTHCIGYVLGGAAGEFYTPGGQRDIDASFLVMLNAWHQELPFRVPELPVTMEWEPLVDTALPSGCGADGRTFSAGEVFPLKARSFALFINVAPEKPAPTPTGLIRPEEQPAALPVDLVRPPAAQPAEDEDETPP